MADPKIILEYIRTLIWPMFALIIVLVYHGDISGMISRGVELDILGVNIKGASGENLKNLMAEEEKLRGAIDSLGKNLKEQVNINKTLTSEKDQLQEEIIELQAELVQARLLAGEDPTEFMEPTAAGEPEEATDNNNEELVHSYQKDLDIAQSILAGSLAKKASELEKEGFEFIIDSKWESALDRFQSAYEVYPEYHNVSEIRRLLRRNIVRLISNDTETVSEVLNSIVDRYSWGAPRYIIEAIKEQIEEMESV